MLNYKLILIKNIHKLKNTKFWAILEHIQELNK